jgi:MFS family permease
MGAASILFVLAIVGIFVAATRQTGTYSERNRRAGLGFMAIVCGPLTGACLAWLASKWDDVHPADVKHTYVVLIVIGAVAGYCVGILFAVTALFCTRKSAGKPISAKPADLADDL